MVHTKKDNTDSKDSDFERKVAFENGYEVDCLGWMFESSHFFKCNFCHYGISFFEKLRIFSEDSE